VHVRLCSCLTALHGEVPSKLAEMNLTRLDVSRTKISSLRYIDKITTLKSLDLSLSDIRSIERLSSA
jgi:Leucine-rich repeat (LRR) protein